MTNPPDRAAWPGRKVRSPSLGSSTYVMHRAIRRSLESARDRYLWEGIRVLDAGGGELPYYPLFSDRAVDYAGSEITPGPNIAFVGPLEELTAPDDAFDLVLCTQVLEHVRHPRRVLEQLARVLSPRGYLFLTTHGVYPFHPHPRDYWRWTQDGLRALIEDVPELELIELIPHNGSASTLAMLAASGVRELASALRAPWLGVPFIGLLNILGLTGDRLLGTGARERLVATFLIVARRRDQEVVRASS